jgi:signal transduction histidine kinase
VTASRTPDASLYDDAPCGLVSFTDDRRIVAINRTLLDLVGRTASEVTALDTLFSLASRMFLDTHVTPTLQLAARLDELHLTLRPAGGDDIPVLVTAVRRPRDGVFVNDAVILPTPARRRFEDELLLARQAAERALAEKEAAHRAMMSMQKGESLGALAAGVAHDYNNLLATIQGNAELAADDLPDHHPARPLLGEVRAAASSAARLTAQLLAYTGRARLVAQSTDAAALVRSTCALLGSSVARARRLVVETSPGLPRVNVDHAHLGNVLVTLVTNAVEATEERPDAPIHVRVYPRQVDADLHARALGDERAGEGAYLAVEVEDAGCGMDVTTRERMFDPFFSTKFLGRGLGLAALLGTVKAHGALVVVEGARGRGTTVTVLFPVPPAEEAATSPPVRTLPARTRGPCVLVVEDDEQVRRLTVKMLARLALEPLDVASGERALEVLEARADIACLALDLELGGISGSEVLRRLRASGSDLPVILASGRAIEEIDELARQDGRAYALAKPFTVADLRDVLVRIGLMPNRGLGARP